jgi:hypothetical protein
MVKMPCTDQIRRSAVLAVLIENLQRTEAYEVQDVFYRLKIVLCSGFMQGSEEDHVP